MIDTKIKIKPENWNFKKQEVKRSESLYSQINLHLNQIRDRITNLYLEYLSVSTQPNKKEFDRIIKNNLFVDNTKKNKKTENNKKIYIIDTYKQFLNSKSSTITESTIKKYKTVYNHLIYFQEYSKMQLTFDNINIEFFDDFKNYLIKNCNLNINWVSKIITIFKSYLNWCYDRDYHKDLAFRKFSIKTEETEIFFLSSYELNKIIQLDLKENQRLEKVRDIFLFQCYTGQRYDDVRNLKFSDICDNIWTLRTRKTKEIINIRLFGQALRIYEKYKLKGDCFPAISNQKANTYLKELCKLAEIDTPTQKVSYIGGKRVEKNAPKYEFITTHIARKTFVTLSIENGILPDVIMKITGHKSYDVFKKYEKITSKLVDKEMARVWDNIN